LLRIIIGFVDTRYWWSPNSDWFGTL